MFSWLNRIRKRGWKVNFPNAQKSYQLLIEKMKRGEHFTFTRWGDGEWESVLKLRKEGEATMNCDGHEYFDSLQEALQQVLKSNPEYYLGMQRLAYHRVMGREIDQFLTENNIQVTWLAADALHKASEQNKLGEFFEILRKSKRVLVVGPNHLQKLNEFKFNLVAIPDKNCWLMKDQIMNETLKQCQRDEPEFILICAGMAGNYIADQLHHQVKATIIDVGSLLDPFAGVISRTYHTKLKISTDSVQRLILSLGKGCMLVSSVELF